MNKFLVLTANTANKDILFDPINRFSNCDYIAYVDNINYSSVWTQKQAANFSKIDSWSDRRNAKLYKILSPYSNTGQEYTVWHDACRTLEKNPQSLVDTYGDHDLFLFNHHMRNCIYDEFDILEKYNLDCTISLKEQRNHYLSKQYPKQNGLFELTCFIKRNTPQVKRLELMWWEQICKYGSRDQTSFMYCLWQMKDELSIKVLSGTTNPYFGTNEYFLAHANHKY